MAKGDICKAPNCKRSVTQNRHTMCVMHFSRWRRYKSFDLPVREKLPNDIVKVCPKHGHLKAHQVKQTHIKRKRAANCPGFPWRDAYCIYCHQINQQKGRIKHKYGITRDEYRAMIEKQNGVCANCGEEEKINVKSGKKRKLCIDHNHETGAIRELLCSQCNVGIGMLRESIALLYKTIDYLKRHGITD